MNKEYASELARALWHLDRAMIHTTGTPQQASHYDIREPLSKLFTASGYEYSERPPAIRKRKPVKQITPNLL